MRLIFPLGAVTSSRLLSWIVLGLVAATPALGGCAMCAPGKGTTLTEDSRKDPACEKEIKGSLDAVIKHLGMKTKGTKADVDSLMASGKVVKGYARDGVRYRWTIGLRKKDGKCKVMAYKQEKERPAKSSTSWLNFASVDLSVCHCK